MEVAVVALSVCLCLTVLALGTAVPLLWWRCHVLQQCNDKVRADVDKLDTVLEALVESLKKGQVSR